jgi:FixJ family two-component response regulator
MIRGEDPTARIIVLTMSQADEDIYWALDAGAITYLVKDTVADDLLNVIREVNVRQPAIGGDVLARLTEPAGRPRLSQSEVQVIELISRGLRNKEIGAALGISEETVNVHVKRFSPSWRFRTGPPPSGWRYSGASFTSRVSRPRIADCRPPVQATVRRVSRPTARSC